MEDFWGRVVRKVICLREGGQFSDGSFLRGNCLGGVLTSFTGGFLYNKHDTNGSAKAPSKLWKILNYNLPNML